MPVEITFLRHAETAANDAGVWQGHGDTPFSAVGEDQLRRLADRMRGRPFDLVLSSDLGRAMATARAVASKVEPGPGWREADIGTWEGLTREQIAESHADELAALQRGEESRMGGGETYPEFSARVEAALATTLARLDDGERALVVAHGGVIGSVVRTALGVERNRHRPVTRIGNTALTTIIFEDDGSRRLSVFNDRSHLNGQAGDDEGLVWIIRHGQSEGNVTGRWQGVTDGPLTAEGSRQAVRLAEWGLPLGAMYTSPLRRARLTAEPVAAGLGVEPVARPDLAEIDFGAWEDLTTDEIAAAAPDEWRQVYVAGKDLPRGGTGETWAGAADRIGTAVADVSSRHADEAVGVVTHGGATQAFVCSVLGLGFPERKRLVMPANTSVSRVAVADGRFRLDAYNLTPHLES